LITSRIQRKRGGLIIRPPFFPLKRIRNMEEHREPTPQERIAELIRQRSEAGKLMTEEEIRGNLPEPPASDEGGSSSVIQEALTLSEDLRAIPGANGTPRYYSAHYMSETYATLLIRKEGDPLLMIADTVRENSRVYPRPIRRETFKNTPFDLTDDEIAACLEQIHIEDRYEDIRQTVSSEGTVFLYSTRHLDPDHASMLAEWLDVGQYRNP
jgi:hypothetical protein